MDVEVEGLDDVKRLLGDVAPNVASNIMRSTVHAMAGNIAKEAKKFAPEDDGVLIDNIKTQRRRVRNGLARSDVMVQSPAFYWRFLEYGTSKLPAVGYFVAAIEVFGARMEQVFLREFLKKYTAALKRAARRNG